MHAFVHFLRTTAALIALLTLVTPPAFAQSAVLTLHVGTGADDSATPLLYALNSGLFKKAGLDVQVDRMNSGAAVVAAVAGGSLEIGKSSLLNIIVAHTKGIPLTLVAPGGLYLSDKPLGGMVVAANSTIRTAADLRGKTVQTGALRDINTLATRAWMDAHGIDSSTIHFIEMPPLDALAAIDQGRIDGATLVTPMYTQAISSTKARASVPMFDGIGPRYLITGWFANESFVEAHREAIGRFADVMREAEAYCNTHTDAIRPIIAAFTGLEPALIAKMQSTIYPATLDRRDIQPIIDVAVRYKVLDKTLDAQDLISSAVVKAATH
jgi:NitT/TauT family transport system substrate-binding protein